MSNDIHECPVEAVRVKHENRLLKAEEQRIEKSLLIENDSVTQGTEDSN